MKHILYMVVFPYLFFLFNVNTPIKPIISTFHMIVYL